MGWLLGFGLALPRLLLLLLLQSRLSCLFRLNRMCFVRFEISLQFLIICYCFLRLKEYDSFVILMLILVQKLNRYYLDKPDFNHCFFFDIHLSICLNMLVNYWLNFASLKIIIKILSQICFYYECLLQRRTSRFLAFPESDQV